MGIIHTNYMFYARGETGGVVKKPIVRAACAFTVRAHCHRIIKLSGALQDYAKEKELVENVHGVRLKMGNKQKGPEGSFMSAVFFHVVFPFFTFCAVFALQRKRHAYLL